MDKTEKPAVLIPMDDFIRQLATLAGQAAAEAVLARHQAACQVNELAVEVWGNGKPGLKTEQVKQGLRLENVETGLVHLEQQNSKARSYFLDLSKPVLAALLVAVIFYFMTGYKNQSAAGAAVPAAPSSPTARPDQPDQPDQPYQP